MPKFTKPPQLQLPEGTKDGEQFEAVGTFVVHGDQLTLVKIDDHALPGYEDEAKEHTEPAKQPGMEEQLKAVFASQAQARGGY